ncbi:MAG: tetratricopeptide repeat protein [Acidobacteriota bacterium]|nr:tetratricopeptide repeat protein [Acidobacteriota bacterium]
MMKINLKILGLLVWLLASGCASLLAQSETIWTGRLVSNAGNAFYNLRIEITRPSSDTDIEKLGLYREAVPAKEFHEYFVGESLGVLRVAGEGGHIVLPVNVVTKKKTKDGWQFLLVARNFPVEPGVKKIIRGGYMAGVPMPGSGGARTMRQDRFVAVVLDVGEDLSGEGRIYDDAEMRFTVSDVELVSSPSRPRLITALRIGEPAPGGEKGNAPRLLADKNMTSSLKEAAQRIRAEEDTPAARAYPAQEMHRDMDAMNYQAAADKIGKSAAAGPVPSRLKNALAYARYRMHQPEEARRILEGLIKDRPKDLQAHVLLSCLQYQSGLSEEAEKTASAFQKHFETYFADGANPTKEERDLIKEIVPNAGLPAYLLGLRARTKADYPAAIKWLALARSLGYDRTDCWIQRTYVEYKQGHWRDVLWTGLQGTDFSDAEMPQDAKIPSYVHMGKGDLDIPAEIWLLEGIALEHLEQPKEALFAFESAERRKPYDPEILKQLAVRYERGDKPEAADALWRRRAALHPQEAQARELWKGTLAKNPSSDRLDGLPLSDDFMTERDVRYRYAFHTEEEKTADRMNRSALQMVGEGRNKEALELLTSFAEIFERSPTIHYNIALLEKNLGRSLEALRWAVKTIEQKRDAKDAYDLAGNVFHQIGDYDASLRFYLKALEIDTSDALSHYNLGCAYGGREDYAKAEKSFRTAVLQDKARRSVHGENRTDETKIELDIGVESVSAMAYRSLGYLFVTQGRKDEAVEMFLNAIAANPSVPQPYFEVGKLRLEKKDDAGADEYFKKFLSIGGDEAKVKALRKT